MVTTWKTISVNEVKPTSRCSLARRSWPKARSSVGTRAIRTTWASSRTEATSPLSRPTEVSPVAQPARSWTPRSVSHQYVTSRSDSHSVETLASRTPASTRARRPSGSGRACTIVPLIGLSFTSLPKSLVIPTLRAPAGSHVDPSVSRCGGAALLSRRGSVRKVSTGDACPLSVAPAAGLVWIVDRCGGELAHLLAVDPDTGQRSGSLLTVSGGGSVLVSSPETRPQTLVLGDTDQSPSRLHLLQVTGGPIPTVAETAETETGALRSVAFTPDGRSLVVAYSSNGYYHQVLSADDLSEAEHYDAQAYPDAVAVRGDGMVAAGFFAWYSPDIYLYRPGTNASPRRYEIGDTEGRTLQPDGLAFGNDRLYAVTADVSKHNPWLHVIDPSTPSSVSAVPDRLTYDNGDTARVTVHLDPFTVGQQVRVRATVSGRTYEVGTGPVDEAGEFSVATPVSRTTTFSAVLLGADGQPTGAAPAAVAVSVRASVSTIMVGGYASRHGYRLYHAGRRALTKTTFAPHRGGVCVRLRLQGRVSTGTWRTFRLSDCLPVNDAGHVWRHVNQHRSVGDRLRVRAEWAGDRVNAARTGDWAFARFTR